MARKRVEDTVPALESWDDVNQALATIADNQRTVENFEAAMQNKIDEAKAEAEARSRVFIEATKRLERQINTMYYQRILASQDKASVAAEIQLREPKPEYEKIVKDPYVMEFLQIQPDTHVYESDLEQALIDHLQQFLLELGRGFSFVSRQKRFTLDGQSFFIDLVFYNYILKCFVLIDLKTDTLTHQDIGQMQMYVNYYTREMMNEGDNPPIGIVLCAEKNDAVVRYTLPENNTQIFTSKYKTYLPSEDELKRELRLDSFHKLDE